MQNLSPSTPTPQPLPTDLLTPLEKLRRAQDAIVRTRCLADDEANDHLTWGDCDRMSRQLTEATRLMREAIQTLTPASVPVASCVECGEIELADCLAASNCPTCAYTFAVSH